MGLLQGEEFVVAAGLIIDHASTETPKEATAHAFRVLARGDDRTEAFRSRPGIKPRPRLRDDLLPITPPLSH
jgi:hypothetical protein